METEPRSNRITLSIARPTNELLEAIQHYQRKGGSRQYKSKIIHDALERFAQGMDVFVNRGGTCVEDDQDCFDFFREGDVKGGGTGGGLTQDGGGKG